MSLAAPDNRPACEEGEGVERKKRVGRGRVGKPGVVGAGGGVGGFSDSPTAESELVFAAGVRRS